MESSSASSCGRNSQQVAARKFRNLADIAEARAHHFGLIAELLVIVVNRAHGHHAGVFGRRIVAARVFLVPVENAAHERRDQSNTGLGACDCLMQPEQQRQIAVNAFFLENLARA